MIPPGTEMLVGFVQDPVFGPLVQVGAGGVPTDLMKDRAARLLPLTDRDARDMMGSLRIAPLLTGFRDAPPLDVAALTDVLHRVARLAADLPSVAELDINPLILCPSGWLFPSLPSVSGRCRGLLVTVAQDQDRALGMECAGKADRSEQC